VDNLCEYLGSQWEREVGLLSNFAADHRQGFSSNTRSFGPSIALVPSERLRCGAILMKLRILSFLRGGLPSSRDDLEAEWLVVAGLRSQKLEEITELLSISPDADEAVRIMKWWRETGAVSTPAKLKNHADRLVGEFRSLNELSLEILDELEGVAPALVNP
jgi:hypothetical protein